MTPGLLTRVRLAFTRGKPTKPLAASRRRSARAAVAWFFVTAIVFSGGTLLASDVLWPQLRDPEYGRRMSALRDRLAENPGRPLVLVVGSSRVAGAIAPAAWEVDAGRTDPIVFNLGRAGAGPLLQYTMLRRVYADGFRPAVVLLEYWPPVVGEGNEVQASRLAPDQAFVDDFPLIRDYFPDPDEFERQVWRNRANPIFGLRRTLMLQIAPTWLPWSQRASEALWAPLDGWGWLPGLDLPIGPSAERDRWTADRAKFMRPQLQRLTVSPSADRALRESVALAREHGAAVGFVFLPESSEFRSWYPRKAERASRKHLAELTRELNVPLIDTRDWMPDGYFLDGFHLTRLGAEEFTRRLTPAVVATFPEVRP